MNRIKKLHCFSEHINPSGEMPKFGSSWCRIMDKCQKGVINAENIVNNKNLVTQSGAGTVSPQERLILVKQEYKPFGSPISMNQIPFTVPRRFVHFQNDSHLSRDWLVKLWVEDYKMRSFRLKRWPRVFKQVESGGGRGYSGASVTEEGPAEEVQPVLQQPPISQSATGFLKPTSPEEVIVAPLLARSNLLITRDIEWANLVLGIEQENKYGIVDACYPKLPVGFIREQSNFIVRQLLRLRRPFVAYITDAMGNELFKIRRPFWWITSTIFAEIDGKVIGVVHRRWHLWRRVYDLYLGNKQFAVVENPGFWFWTFTLKDYDGKVLAEIDRDWRGFGFELLTDAGQYVIRFGDADKRSKVGLAKWIQDLEVIRPLTLSERAVTVALAVSLDNDYFSRHGSWGIPFFAAGE
ncbi:hypothetical protein GIB67_040889 [Kingdonia uniflora]|uniref:Phospholipid scramblase n=1 Tax=Kingdonia uniflora TaxID=39325 RepID=A0A7J7L7Z1_9MAGN|nr:hypothetical protein GIB67_040889 [Kingdonia uniflora]